MSSCSCSAGMIEGLRCVLRCLLQKTLHTMSSDSTDSSSRRSKSALCCDKRLICSRAARGNGAADSFTTCSTLRGRRASAA